MLSRTIFTLPFVALATPFVVASSPAGQNQEARMRFEAMDRNGNGMISRDEWSGSSRSFEVHDWNGAAAWPAMRCGSAGSATTIAPSTIAKSPTTCPVAPSAT